MSVIQQRDKEFVAGTYARFPISIVRAKGSLCYDEQGKEYIDMGSGIGVTAFGHADDAWREAVVAQLGCVAHTSNLYYTDPCTRLAELLCAKTGLKKVFFSNSGAEANECAIKLARKYAADKKGAEYSTVVTLKNSFHGRTLTTLSATGQDHYHELFQPLTPGFVHVTAGDLDELEQVVATHKVAGILMECVQGEGGVIAMDEAYVKGVAEIAAREDFLFMIDEVQTGNGRTGELYSYMHYGVTPDVVTTAKGLGGGLPIGATLMGEKAQNVLGFGDHGSTFGGNPVCAAGACSIISRIDDALLAKVREKSAYVFKTLEGKKGIKSVTGKGLMIGIETERPAKELVATLNARGVLCLTAKHKLRLLPALNIPMDVLKRAVEAILAAAAE